MRVEKELSMLFGLAENVAIRMNGREQETQGLKLFTGWEMKERTVPSSVDEKE
jgi:hypothetical protein